MKVLRLRAANGAEIKIFNEDCLRGMPSRLAPDSVDVVVTSPPYNIGVRYSKYRDKLPRSEYLAWIADVGRALRIALKPEGSFFLNVGGIPSDPWIPWDVAQSLRGVFVLQNVIHWVKSIAIQRSDVGNYSKIVDDLAVGHYKPIGGRRFIHDCHEYIFHFTKSGDVPVDRLAIGVPYQDKSNIGRWNQAVEDRRCRGNTWFIPYKTIRDRQSQRPHPASFPVSLPEMCIRLHGLKKTRLVLDPFMGIGSTAVAAARLGVSCVGFELDSEYIQEIARREIAKLVSGGPVQSKHSRIRQAELAPG